MIFIFDIDGTVADASHRLHFIQQNPKDWKSFYLACAEDKPIWEVITIVKALAPRYSIVFITGRSDEIRTQTYKWLNDYEICLGELLMRKENDHREDAVVKSELLDRLEVMYPEEKVAGIFEDRTKCVDMYRVRGLRVFQVADGDF